MKPRDYIREHSKNPDPEKFIRDMEAEFLTLVETKKKCAWNKTQYLNAIKEVGDKWWSVMRKCQPLRDAGTRPYEAWRSFLQNHIEPKGREWGFEKEVKK